jgi:putative solute:sodium symporter small subunit
VGKNTSYWRANLRLTAFLLFLWFLLGFAGPILGIEWLNQFRIGNLGAGFWLAQQGSIVAFVLIVLVYAILMDRLDKRCDDRDLPG